MTNQTIGLLIGGLLPAVFYGISGVFAKPATEAGIGMGLYIMLIGLAVSLTGLFIYGFSPDNTISMRSGIFTVAVGLTWAIGAAGVAVALASYQVPVSRLVPLYNMNTLVAVLLGLVIFSQWKDVQLIKESDK